MSELFYMKPIICLFICIMGFPLYGSSQEINHQELKSSKLTLFGWEINLETFFFKTNKKNFLYQILLTKQKAII